MMKISFVSFLFAILSTTLVKSKNSVIDKEVCVIGGGAAGSYTAYELQKRGYDVVLFEPQSDLGGNCEILEIPSQLNPSVTYTINAAVIVFSPRPVVLDFFEEFNAATGTLNTDSIEPPQRFVYGPGFVIPAPPPDPVVQGAALQAYTTIVNSPPYEGINVIPPLPDWQNLSTEQQDALLEPFSDFLARNPDVAPLRPIISAIMQGFGFVDTRPMWEVLAYGGPTFISQIFLDTFLTLRDGCQDLYDTLQQRMIQVDPESVQLDTTVKSIRRRRKTTKFTTKFKSILSKKKFNSRIKSIIRRKNGNVKLRVRKNGVVSTYRCQQAIAAFRPIGLGKNVLKDITRKEKKFFNDLGYNGYIPSVWSMEVGPSLLATGVDPAAPLDFISAEVVNVGIISLSKEQSPVDYPWRLFYQPAEPADTPEKLQAVQDQIVADLTAIGFINISPLFISNHLYGVKPQSREKTLEWTEFFNNANTDGDGLFWTGSVPGGEASENVWQYSLDLMNANFPPKNA